MRAGADEQVTDLDHAVQAIAKERGDAQRAREFVRLPGRLRAHDDVLRPQHEQAVLARREPVSERAGDGAAERSDATGGHHSGEEGGLTDEVGDES